MAPDFGESWGGYTSWGCLTRSVRDAAALIDVMAGPAAGDPCSCRARAPARRGGRSPPGKAPRGLHPRFALRQGNPPRGQGGGRVRRAPLADLGHEVEEARPEFNRELLVRAYLIQIAAGVAAEIEEMGHWVGRKPSAAYFEPCTWFLYQIGRRLSAAELQQSRDAAQTGRAFARRFLLALRSRSYADSRLPAGAPRRAGPETDREGSTRRSSRVPGRRGLASDPGPAGRSIPGAHAKHTAF